jgi:hypothetical protein
VERNQHKISPSNETPKSIDESISMTMYISFNKNKLPINTVFIKNTIPELTVLMY